MKLVRALLFSGIVSGLLTLPSLAQTATPAAAPYWNLYVSNQQQNPTIRFYSAANQLVYEEELSKEMAQMTRHNVSVFNQVLASVANRRLVGSQLSQASDGSTLKPNFYEGKQVWYKNGIATFMANPRMKEPGKLHVHYSQMDDQLVIFTLTSENGESIHYKDQSRRLTYSRLIDLKNLPSGAYKLLINHPDQEFSYQLEVNQPLKLFSIHPH